MHTYEALLYSWTGGLRLWQQDGGYKQITLAAQWRTLVRVAVCTSTHLSQRFTVRQELVQQPAEIRAAERKSEDRVNNQMNGGGRCHLWLSVLSVTFNQRQARTRTLLSADSELLLRWHSRSSLPVNPLLIPVTDGQPLPALPVTHHPLLSFLLCDSYHRYVRAFESVSAAKDS